VYVIKQQEQQRVAVGPRNVQFVSIRHVSLRLGTCGHCGPLLLLLQQLMLLYGNLLNINLLPSN